MESVILNREYERNMNHTYIILEKPRYFEEEEEETDYRKNMLLENVIPGLLPVTYHRTGDSSKYYYEINSLETLDKLLENEEMSYEQLQKLLLGVIRLFQSLEEYLLEGAPIVMRPDSIYLDSEKWEPYFICYPDYEGDIRQEFVELVDYVLAKIDHTDERAVMLGYQVYRYTRNPNYVLSEIHHMLRLSGEEEIVDVPERKIYTESESQKNDEDGYSQYTGNLYLTKDKKEVTPNKSKAIRIPMIISAVAGLLLVEEYMMGLLELAGIQMVYLCGIVALAGMVAAIMYYGSKKETQVSYRNMASQPSVFMEEGIAYGEGTVCLSDTMEEYFAKEHSLKGQIRGQEINYPLHRFPLTIGKQEGISDLIVSDDTVSRQHAKLEQVNGNIYISDMNSTNGTVKNGKPLKKGERCLLEQGDKIRLGNVSLTLC